VVSPRAARRTWSSTTLTAVKRRADHPEMLADFFEIEVVDLDAKAVGDPHAAVRIDVDVLRHAPPALLVSVLLHALTPDASRSSFHRPVDTVAGSPRDERHRVHERSATMNDSASHAGRAAVRARCAVRRQREIRGGQGWHRTCRDAHGWSVDTSEAICRFHGPILLLGSEPCCLKRRIARSGRRSGEWS
jgi:hypothetical protein